MVSTYHEYVLHRQQQCNSSHHPFGRWLFGAEVEAPYICGPTLLSTIYWTLVSILELLLLCRHSFDKQHRHGWIQIPQECVGYHSSLNVPACAYEDTRHVMMWILWVIDKLK